ncbi:MAG: hypothetical protein ACRDHZ_03885, partial [Ktedonobacteraceae bacterium]
MAWLRGEEGEETSRQHSCREPAIKAEEVAKLLAEIAPPGVRVEFVNYQDILFLYRLGCAEWTNLWCGTMAFQHIIDHYGTEADKIRLTEMGLGYRYRPASSRL